jgi:GGDEF domain-containing protein
LALAASPRTRRPTATSESTRARRFALPALADERTEESIEAFLHGRGIKGGSRTTALVARDSHLPEGDAVALRTMPGRAEWNAAVERESQRAARYERPAAVAVLELRPLRPSAVIDSWLRAHAAPIGQVLLRQSRASDVVARVGTARFQVLLPETTADAAGEFVERVVGECQERLQALGAPLRLAASVAASTPDLPLRDAVTRAVDSIEAATDRT